MSIAKVKTVRYIKNMGRQNKFTLEKFKLIELIEKKSESKAITKPSQLATL